MKKPLKRISRIEFIADKLGKLIPLLLIIGFFGFCIYLASTELDIVSFYNAISHSLIYKIFFFFYLGWFLIYLPFALYEVLKYYFTDLHKYNQEDELNAETKEIREYIKLRRGG